MSKFSCKDCTERYIGCHAKCEKYIKEKEKHNAVIQEENKDKILSHYFKNKHK